jgi:hypothetical protein
MNKTLKKNETILGPFIQMATFDWTLFRLALEVIVCRMFSGQQMTLLHNSFEWRCTTGPLLSTISQTQLTLNRFNAIWLNQGILFIQISLILVNYFVNVCSMDRS